MYLVRHTHAVGRSSWSGDDEGRPLSKKGMRQAAGLVKLLGDKPIRRILSSPAVRCVDSMVPLADELGLTVTPAPELLEGASATDALDLLLGVAAKPGDSALCTHGDLVPELLWALAARGAKLNGGDTWAKGSTWALRFDDDMAHGRYHPPLEA